MVHDTVISAILHFQGYVLFGIFVALVSFSVWYYRKRTQAYAELPSYSFLPNLVYIYLFREFPKNIPSTSYLFQRIIEDCPLYAPEGLLLVWAMQPILGVFGVEATKIFLNEEAATDKSYKYKPFQDAFGEGLVSISGETWRNRRKMFNPVFHLGMLKNKISLFNEHANILVKNTAEYVNSSGDLLNHLRTCTFGVICESILGINIHEEKNRDFSRKFLELVTKLSECTFHRMVHPWLIYKFFLHFTPFGRECLKLYKERLDVISKIVLAMKESFCRKTSDERTENEERKSFVHILLEHHMKDPSFTIKTIEDEVTTFLLGGYDTTSYTLMWCLFLLGHHPDVQEKVYHEVESETDEFITYEQSCRLNYLECVIKETLRLYPVVPLFARQLSKDVQCGKYKVPKDTNIVFIPYLLHRNPENFPDPEKFNPDRFLEGNTKIRPWFLTPFSEGVRSCIGKKFAMIELKVILANFLRNYKVTSLDRREDVHLCWELMLVPAKPLRMQINFRKPD